MGIIGGGAFLDIVLEIPEIVYDYTAGQEAKTEAGSFLFTLICTEFEAFHAQRAIEEKATQ